MVASCTNEGGGLLVEHSTGQQVEVVLHRVHDHRVTRVVASLYKHSAQSGSSLQHSGQITKADTYITPQPAVEKRVSLSLSRSFSLQVEHLPCRVWFFFFPLIPLCFSWCGDGTSMSYQSEFHACDTFLGKVKGGAFHGRSA